MSFWPYQEPCCAFLDRLTTAPVVSACNSAMQSVYCVQIASGKALQQRSAAGLARHARCIYLYQHNNL